MGTEGPDLEVEAESWLSATAREEKELFVVAGASGGAVVEMTGIGRPPGPRCRVPLFSSASRSVLIPDSEPAAERYGGEGESSLLIFPSLSFVAAVGKEDTERVSLELGCV